MIVPSSLQVLSATQEALVGIAQTVTGDDLPISVRFSFPSAKKANCRLSGDQNAFVHASTVSESSLIAAEMLSRTHGLRPCLRGQAIH